MGDVKHNFLDQLIEDADADRVVDVGAGNILLDLDGGDPLWAHNTRDGDYCSMGPLTDHDVKDLHPDVTVGGSLGCPACGRHGFVRDGRWEEAAPLPTD